MMAGLRSEFINRPPIDFSPERKVRTALDFTPMRSHVSEENQTFWKGDSSARDIYGKTPRDKVRPVM